MNRNGYKWVKNEWGSPENSKSMRNHFEILDFPSFVRQWADQFCFFNKKMSPFKQDIFLVFWFKTLTQPGTTSRGIHQLFNYSPKFSNCSNI